MTTWQTLHAASDRLTPRMVRALLEAFAQASRRVPVTAIIEAVKSAHLRPGEVERLIAAIPQLVRAAASPSVSGLVDQASRLASDELAARLILRADAFEVVNPFAVNAARSQSAQLVTRVSAEARLAIRSIVRAAIESGIPARDAGRLIRTVVGLNEGQALAVINFRQRLEKAGAAPDRVAAMADKYAARLLRQRAEMIARTELMDALNAGQQAAWARAQAKGLLPPLAQQEWLVTPDDRLCPVCQQMSGVRTLISRPFPTPLGPKSGPPLHPHCRCTVILVAKTLRRVA